MTRHVSRHVLLAAAVLAFAVCLYPAPAQAQAAPTLDHFWCYGIQGPVHDKLISLRDQWDPVGAVGPPVLLRNAVRFCNPVEKTDRAGVVTPITNPDAHLKLYLISPHVLSPTRRVVVNNQFGKQRIYTFDPGLIGVPSAKNTDIPPKGLDHFKCYRAYGPALFRKIVRLKDQFTEGRVKVNRAVAFCNPTEKLHDEVITPIENPKGHLVCYTVTRTEAPERTAFFNVDQFGIEKFITPASDILCVPSEKLDFAVIP
jgi:hypothetical protein